MNNKIDPDAIREWFPALRSADILLDNAGGSQVPRTVIDRVRDYFVNSFVQVGADYPAGKRATQTIDDARRVLEVLVNCGDTGHVAMGPSTSVLCARLAQSYAQAPIPGRDEIIVCQAGHEANVGPWTRMAAAGYTVKWWNIEHQAFTNPLDELEALLSERTRILAVPHVSNLLGRIDDARTWSRMAHAVGARIVVDGVAFAPHRAIDVQALEVDWYVFSIYKVYGPHMAAMFGTHEAFAEISGPNHFFVDPADMPDKFELGGVLHEGCAGVLGLPDYFNFLADRPDRTPFDRDTVNRAYDTMTDCELPLQRQLIEYLRTKEQVRLIGPLQTDRSRVGTISFVHRSKSSKEIVLAANEQDIGIRYGHFYAHRLASALVRDPEDGVVRISLVHYNTAEEIDRVIACLETLL